MMSYHQRIKYRAKFFKTLGGLSLAILIIFLTSATIRAKSSDFPPRPNPPRLVNDLAHMMTPSQADNLEQKLVEIARQTSTQITIITITSLGDYEPSQYVTELGNLWGIGQKGKDNGVIIFASKNDKKLNISPGYGLEGALPDITCFHIIQNEIRPEFKKGNFYLGFSNAADAVIAATKGEYKSDKKAAPGGFNLFGLLFLVIIIAIIILVIRKGGGGGRGNGHYLSHGGSGFLTGAILGGMLGGGFGGGGAGFGGGGGLGGGGFGGFGGGGFGGGGASGGW